MVAQAEERQDSMALQAQPIQEAEVVVQMGTLLQAVAMAVQE
jgi:hypothetical protein